MIDLKPLYRGVPPSHTFASELVVARNKIEELSAEIEAKNARISELEEKLAEYESTSEQFDEALAALKRGRE